jgi:hypothetical protein
MITNYENQRGGRGGGGAHCNSLTLVYDYQNYSVQRSKTLVASLDLVSYTL